MTPRQQKIGARLILASFAVAGVFWALGLNFHQKISTNVLDLVPSNEASPALALARSLASEKQSRVVLLALDWPDAASVDAREKAANALTEALEQSGQFDEVMPLSEEAELREALGRYIYEHRLELLLPGWLAQREREYAQTDGSLIWPDWLAQRVASDLTAFVREPDSLPFMQLVPADPLLLVPELAQRAGGLMTGAAEEDANGTTTLVWARMQASPFDEVGQQLLFHAVEQALAAAHTIVPGAKLHWTGVARFAAESRRRIQREMSWLNVLTLLAVMGVAALAVRRMHQALHLVPVVFGALLGAWMATTLVFDRVHVLVFVIGSLLGGVAVDYGFYLYIQPRLDSTETYAQKVRRLIKPLLASALTTVLGFSLLLFSELPLIQELGVFVSAGLLSALIVALLWFAQVRNTSLETRRIIHLRPQRVTPRVRRSAQVALLLGALVAVFGPWRLQWHDDIHELSIPTPRLNANDQAVRAQFGDTAERTVYLTRGDSLAAARRSLEQFLDWHHQQYPEAQPLSLGLVFPTETAWQAWPEQQKRLADWLPRLRVALLQKGFKPDSFRPFYEAWNRTMHRDRGDYAALMSGLSAQLRGPLAMMAHVGPHGAWFATMTQDPPGVEPPAATATVSVSQLQSLNALFTRYRLSILKLSSLGLALVGLSVFVIYGWRRGARIFAVPVGSCLFAFGLLGAMGATLNLFHLLGAFLGVCLSHNYAIFSAENADRGEVPPPSIRLSAVTTATSFGVLALSQIPVVAALGETVALIVVSALLIVELAPLTRRGDLR